MTHTSPSMQDTDFKYWKSDTFGLIRQKKAAGAFHFPEVWHDGRWSRGTEFVMDAVIGMGEDAYSCGEIADEIDKSEAERIAAERNIDLLAE